MGNPLWEFSLATYRIPALAATCLDLQDRFGMDVNLLLYAAWLAHLNRRLDEHHLRDLDAQLGDWREQVVRPLRALRRQLGGYERAAAVHEELKTLELRAEQEQQEMIYAFHQRAAELRGAERPLQHNLAQVARLACPDESRWSGEIRRLAALMPL